jgi:hypothetical protein
MPMVRGSVGLWHRKATIDELLAERARLADAAEASWRRQRELLEW